MYHYIYGNNHCKHKENNFQLNLNDMTSQETKKVLEGIY